MNCNLYTWPNSDWWSLTFSCCGALTLLLGSCAAAALQPAVKRSAVIANATIMMLVVCCSAVKGHSQGSVVTIQTLPGSLQNFSSLVTLPAQDLSRQEFD